MNYIVNKYSCFPSKLKISNVTISQYFYATNLIELDYKMYRNYKFLKTMLSQTFKKNIARGMLADNKLIRKANIFILILFILAFVSNSFDFKQLEVTSTSKIIDAVTDYRIFYDRQNNNFGTTNDIINNPVPAGSTVTLVVPAVYILNYTISVNVIINDGPQQAANFTLSGNIITVNNLFSAQTIVANLTLFIVNIKNPSSAIITDVFNGTIGIDTSKSISLTSFVILEPANFRGCQMTFNPKFVNRTSSMVVNVIVNNAIPVGGGLEILFPASRWTQGRVTSSTNFLPINNAMLCGSISANVKSTIQCQGIVSQNKIQATNMFSTAVLAGQTISFQIKNFISPPTNNPVDKIKITSFDSNSDQINICSDYVTGLIPNVISSSQIFITANQSPVTVNQNYVLKFAFETVDVFAFTDYFEIQFPTEEIFSLATSSLQGQITLIRGTSSFSNNVLRCFINSSIVSRIYINPFSMFILVGTYTAPPSIQSTGNFKISILRNGSPMQVGYQSITPVFSTNITSSLTSRTSQIINRNTTYTFTITINDALSSSGKIRIKFPSQIKILATSSACATVTGSNMVSSPTCVISTAQRTIQLTNLNSTSSNFAKQSLTVAIQGIMNAASTAPTEAFQIRTYYKSTDGSLVAIGSAAGITSKQALIDPSNVQIKSSSYKVLDKTVTYTIKLTTQHEIPLGGSVQLFVPKPVLLTITSLSTSCKRGVNTLTTTATTCSLITQDTSGYLINFTNPLATSALAVGQFLLLQLSGIATNPPSTSPVSTFKLQTFSPTRFAITKIQSSLKIVMTDPTELTTAIYSTDNYRNYDLANYQFTTKQVPVLEAGSLVEIDFPPEILLNVTSQCSMSAPFVNGSLVCGLVNATTIKITLPTSTGAIASDVALVIKITNIRNPSSFKPPGDFSIRTFTPSLGKYAAGKTTNKLPNTVPSAFKQISGQYSPSYLDTPMTLSVSFEPSSQAPGYLHISIPSYFTIPTALSCSQVANFDGTCTSLSTHTLRINGNFISNGLITFQISGFKSTIRPPTAVQYILLSSFTSLNYELDYSSNKVTFDPACTLPCKTCDSPTNKTYCLSCYDNVLVTDKIIFDANSHSCYSKCPDGKYQNSLTGICQDCNINCLTCEGSPIFCTTCKTDSTFKFLNIVSMTSQVCVSQCQQKMYPDATKTPPQCVNCTLPCKTCTSLTFCLTCLETYYFWKNTCSKSCPLGSTVPDNVTGQCQICSLNCLTCSVVVDNCSSCSASLILYNNKCITQCLPPRVYRPQILTCGSCDTICKSCQKVASNCTSCQVTSQYKYLFSATCLKQCPDTYYEGTSNCILCSSLSINCDYCVNSTYCDKCNIGFVFFGGQCLGTTPSGYANISGYAQPCTGDCSTCTITQSNCTSCKTLNLFVNVCQLACPPSFISLNKICVACAYPCRTCSQNTNNCTLCLQNQTPQLYLIQNRCEIECPIFFYADNGTNKCTGCQSPCKKCFDQTTCVTCEQNYFLYQSKSCLSSCPTNFVGINKICEPCTSPCKSCIDSTTKCLTCQPDYYFLDSTNRCLLDCGQGLYEQYLNQTCISCTVPCKTCTNTTNTCLSCLTGILYNNLCIYECPSKMFNDTNICQPCPLQCSSCNSRTVCTNCTSPYILYNNFCITKCPQTHAVILQNACTKCSSINCHKCFDNDLCYNCVSDFSLLNDACLSACPSLFKTNGTHCLQILDDTLSSSSSSMFPVPFTIATSIILIASLMSKLQNDKTFLSGAIFSLLGVIQTLALIYYIFLYYISYYAENPIGVFVALAALGVLYVLNVLSIIQSIVLCYDKKFTQWRDSSIMNKVFNAFSIIVSVLISHKFKNILFCRLFAFFVFSAQLDQVRKFKIFNIFSFLSLAHSGGAIFSVITIIKLADPKTQFFHACIDVLIVTSLNIVLAFFNAMKGQDYFDQLTPEGLLLNKKVYGDEDSFNGKISVAGNDMQNEQGQGYYSKVQHTLASNQAFKFKDNDQSRQDLQSVYDSLTNIAEKQYQQVSVQAYDMLAQQHSYKKTHTIDFSTLKGDNSYNNDSKFTTIFKNQNKSIQNTIDYDDMKKVDYSVQKYDNKQLVDRSMQRTIQQFRNNDISVQYSNNNQKQDKKQVSIQGTIQHVDQSGQYSMMMSQKGVQRTLKVNDRSVQQSIQNKSWGGQNTIQVKDISIQKQQQRVQYDEIDQTLDQHDNTTLKNTDNIFCIQEDEQGQKVENELKNNKGSQSVKHQKRTAQRQQLPQPKEQQFNLPSQEIKSYHQEMQLKILAKQKQLEKVKKQIQIKQGQAKLKERLMRQQKQRLERQAEKEKQVNRIKYQQEIQRLERQAEKEKQVNRIKCEQDAIRQQKRMHQEEQMVRQFERLKLIQLGSKKQKQTQIQKDDKFTMMRMTQLKDQATQMDNQQLFSSDNQQVTNNKKNQNFFIDMNQYIKQKELSEDDNDEQQLNQSTKTKAKLSSRNNIQQQQQQKHLKFQKNRQIQIKGLSNRNSLPLNIQHQQLLNDHDELSSQIKQPGRIRLFDDSNKRPDEQQLLHLEQDLTEEQNKTQNYIYEIEDGQLQEQNNQVDIEFSSNRKESVNNQSNILTNRQNKKTQHHQDKQETKQQYSMSGIRQPKLILDQTDYDKEIVDIHEELQQSHNIQNGDQLMQEFDSSQDIPTGLVFYQAMNNQKNTQSQTQDYGLKRNTRNKRTLSREENLKQEQLDANRIVDHDLIKQQFNIKRQLISLSIQKKKQLPTQNKQSLHVNIGKFQGYQNVNQQKSNKSIPPSNYDKPTSKSLLANNAANNIVMSADNDNQVLGKKPSHQKNPLVTKKKWQYQDHNGNKSVQNGNGSFVYNKNNGTNANNRRTSNLSKGKQTPSVPFQTDKQQTQFMQAANKKAGSNRVQLLPQSSSSINQNQPKSRKKTTTSAQKRSAKQLLKLKNDYGEQVEVNFEQNNLSKQKQKPMRNDSVAERPQIGSKTRPASITSQQRSALGNHLYASKPGLNKFQSQEIFGDSYYKDQEQQRQGYSYYQQQNQKYPNYQQKNQIVSKQHQNDLLMDKLMQRPQNDDLYQYYNKASTQKGKSNKKRSNNNSKEKKRISLSKQKQANDRQLQKIYMQRLESSLTQNNLRSNTNSNSRYNID